MAAIPLSSIITINQFVDHKANGVFSLKYDGASITIRPGANQNCQFRIKFKEFTERRDKFTNSVIPGTYEITKQYNRLEWTGFPWPTSEKSYTIKEKSVLAPFPFAIGGVNIKFTGQDAEVTVMQAQEDGINLGFVDDIPYQAGLEQHTSNPVVPDIIEEEILDTDVSDYESPLDIDQDTIWNIAVIGIVILAAAGLGLYFYSRYKRQQLEAAAPMMLTMANPAAAAAAAGQAPTAAAPAPAPAPAPVIVNVPK